MFRRHLAEIHDQTWFPSFLRDCVTESLQAMLTLGGCFAPIVPRLRRAFAEARTRRVIDLCSGAGGPWIWMYRACACDDRTPLNVCLSDKYPNARAFRRAIIVSNGNIQFHPEPVDATRIPEELKGFRTIFGSFHHFQPGDARLILQDAVEKREGIAIVEAADRNPLTMLLLLIVPVAALGLAVVQRPFRWSRLFWTLVIPVVPIVLFVDGIISCLRAYSVSELTELTACLRTGDYRWDVGREQARFTWVPITYVIGHPSVGWQPLTSG